MLFTIVDVFENPPLTWRLFKSFKRSNVLKASSTDENASHKVFDRKHLFSFELDLFMFNVTDLVLSMINGNWKVRSAKPHSVSLKRSYNYSDSYKESSKSSSKYYLSKIIQIETRRLSHERVSVHTK